MPLMNGQTTAYIDILMGVKVNTVKSLIHKPAYSHHTVHAPGLTNQNNYDVYSYVNVASYYMQN